MLGIVSSVTMLLAGSLRMVLHPLLVSSILRNSPLRGKRSRKVLSLSGDHPTGQFVCQYCERQAKKQNERLEIPEVEKEITSRDRLRGKSKPLSELRQVLKEDFPVLFSELSESEEYREGTHSLGDGNFWRKGGPDAVSD